MNWDWQNLITGQASKTCFTREELEQFIAGWEKIETKEGNKNDI